MGGAGQRQGGMRWEQWVLAGTAPRCSVPAFGEVRLPHSEAWTSACWHLPTGGDPGKP